MYTDRIKNIGQYKLNASADAPDFRDWQYQPALIKLGHINARSNGSDIVMAQKKEKKNVKSPWHKYPIPYVGPFGDH
jgi:hypothetical protein|tara:strand:- start:633 stop:863 length:231 start_codon:yes stop_codon:yes gene_type:complete